MHDKNENINESKIIITQQQENILKSRAGIKRIIACAGSGKTFVLTQAVADILKDGLCRPDEILAITFTRNAAENMRQRIKEILNKKIDYDAINIFTFNSFGNLIISENSFMMGLGKDYRLINISKSWQILYSIIKQAEFRKIAIGKDTGKFIDDVLRYVGDLKSNLISVKELKAYYENRQKLLACFASTALCRQEYETAENQYDLSMLYESYEDIKNNNNLVDYHDHIFKPFKFLSENKKICLKYKKRYRYIFVDEFQDTDVAQGHLMSLLYDPSFNKLTVVGDDDQGIYSFRGACVENILNFHEWENFSGHNVEDFYLTTNFRSGANIVKAINGVISGNKNRFEKDLKSQSEEKHSDVFFNFSQTHEREAEKIIKNIKILLSDGFHLKDIAVISRRKKFRRITEMLDRENLKYELISSRGFFYEPEILFIISWLMVIKEMTSELYLLYLLQSPKYKISDRDIFFLKKNNAQVSDYSLYSKNRESYLIDGVLNYKKNKNISKQCIQRIPEFINELNFYIRQSSFLKLSELINLIFENSGLADELKSDFSRLSKQKIKNIETLIRISSDFEIGQTAGDLDGFILYLKDVAKTDEEDPETIEFSGGNSIKIMSIHAAKGLEFEAVFMPMLNKNNYLGKTTSKKFKLPSLLRKDVRIYKDICSYGSKQKFEEEIRTLNMEEERRIFYVGCSRAKKYLFLSSSGFKNVNVPDEADNKQAEKLIFLEDIFKYSEVKITDDESLEYVKENFTSGKELNTIDFKEYSESLPIGKHGRDMHTNSHKINTATFNSNDAKDSENILAEMIENISVNPFKINNEKIEKVLGKPESLDLFKNFNVLQKRAAGYAADINKLKNSLEASYIKNIRPLKNNFSLTELLAYLNCPAGYKWKYVYNIPEPKSSPVATGEKVHKYLQVLTTVKYKNLTDYYVPADFNISSYLESLKNFEDGEEAYNLADNFCRSDFFNFDDIKHIIMEQLFYWNLEGSVINCKVDRLDIKKDKSLRIIDYKVSSLGNSGIKSNYVSQLNAYTCGMSEIFGVSPENISNFLIYLRDGSVIERYFSQDETENFKKIMIDSIKSINDRKFGDRLTQRCSSCSYTVFCNGE